MRYQTLFLVVFTIVCGIQYSTSRETTTKAPREDDEWNSEENYDLKDDDGYYITDGSYERGPSYKDNDNYDDDDEYNGKDYKNKERRPSYKGNDKYDDDDEYNGNDYKNKGRRPSYKGNDKYDDDDEYNGNDYKNKGRRPSYKGNDKYDDDDEYNGNDYKSKGRRPSKYSSKPKDMGHMNIYLREPSKDGKRKNPKRFRFPVANYERERFPRNFGPLLSFMPWLPIFADRFTKQTIIYSPTGGGKDLAQLIASGYASLVSTGAPPPPAVDVAPLVQPGPVVGPGVPTINPSTGGFKGGVRTDYRSFPRPSYPGNYQERSYSQKDDYSKPKVGY
ncbi:hypothetical protein I4U23_013856 [Adineta vaga]|nr:hypothetical protein I4U23_013856 [Adineta vaga]